MHVLIVGASGMIGRKLTEELVAREDVLGGVITSLTLADINPPVAPDGFSGNVTCLACNLSENGAGSELVKDRPDVIFHLASVVSGEAETDFEKGYHANLFGTYGLLEAIRSHGEDYRPRLVFTSSIAVFGAPMPERIPDDYHCTPRSSYGTQKAICELLINDYSRKGILDGVCIRLPTISVRPGKPNKAASSFFSGIIREPLAGQDAILPVAHDTRHWHASPVSAVNFILHAANLDMSAIEDWRVLNMPGVSVTVSEQISALESIAGPKASAHIKQIPDPAIKTIVDGWPQNFDPKRAQQLGFEAEETFEQIIDVYVNDKDANLEGLK